MGASTSVLIIGAVLGAVVGLLVFGLLWTLQLPSPQPQPVSDPDDSVRIIHQIWFQGEDAIPAKFLPYRRSCSAHNPAWKVVLHDDEALQQACAAVDAADPAVGLLALYLSSHTMHEKIDMGRLAALWVQGGVSVDMDVMCMRELDEILRSVPLDNMGVSSMGLGPLGTAFYAASAGCLGRPFLMINNASWVLPKARSPLLLDLIRKLAVGARRSYAEQPDTHDPEKRIMATWGPTPCSLALVDVCQGLTVFKQPFFEKVASAPFHCDNNETVLCHLHELSWSEHRLGRNIQNLFVSLWSVYAGQPVLVDVLLLALTGAGVGAMVAARVS